MRVYCVRHGARADNSDSILAKRETPLSDEGRRQAALLAERFASIPISAIYSSAYVRTRETTEIINRVTRTKVLYNELIEDLRLDESPGEAFKRELKFVKFLEKLWKKEDEKSILVSAHAGIIKMIVFAMVFEETHLTHSFKEFDASFHMDFTGITLCRFEGRRPWKVVTWNDLGHLPPPA